MQKKDLSAVFKLHKQQQEKYQFTYKLTQDEILYFLLPREDIVWTYVIENFIDGKQQITDFFSMQRLTQLCTSDGCKYDKMHSGSLFYYGLSMNKISDIIKHALWIAKEELDCDAFTVQEQLDSDKETLLDIGFLHGDGGMNYYLVNHSLGNKSIHPNQTGCILA